MLPDYWAEEVRKRLGREAERECLLSTWTRIGKYETGWAMEAANIKGDDVETYVKVTQLMGSFAQGYYKYDFDLKNKNHAILTVHYCPAFNALEKQGDFEHLEWVCKVLEESIIENNVVHGQMRRCGIIVSCPLGGGRNRIVQNTVVDEAPLTIWNGDGELVANNILVAGEDEPIYMDEHTRNVRVEYNLCTPKSAHQATNGITANPMFVDPSKGLFWLRADSPARGRGSPGHAPATDFWGRPRAQDQPPDLGAMPFIPELAGPEARQCFEFGGAYYRHGSGGTVPDLWLLPAKTP